MALETSKTQTGNATPQATSQTCPLGDERHDERHYGRPDTSAPGAQLWVQMGLFMGRTLVLWCILGM